jgi:large subunit ribosomal protein L25
MADKFVIKAEKRDSRGKNEARRLRSAGKVPAIVYGGKGESLAIAAELSDLAAVLRSDTGANTVFSLEVAGVETTDVIFQDRQVDPLKGRLLHADLRRLVKGEKIEMTVPVHLEGDPVGVKMEGGMLEQAVRELKILCDPAKAPDAIHVDVTDLKLGDTLHVFDLKVDEGIEIHMPSDLAIASVHAVKEPELEPQIEEGAQPEVAGAESGNASQDEEAGGE